MRPARLPATLAVPLSSAMRVRWAPSVLAAALVLVPSLGQGAAAGSAVRPALEVHQGRYFRWAAPARWRSNETTNGVDVVAPDGTAAVGFALLMRSYGNVTPGDFMLAMLRRAPGFANLRVVAARSLPDQPSGTPGTSWKIIEAELSLTVNGRPVRAIYTCGINAYYGAYDAVLSGYYAAAADWPRARLFLPEIARSIAITNPRQVAGNDRLLPVKNRPLDDSGLMETWRERGLSQDRIGKARREGTMGYERLKDPETGRMYEMPLEAFDGTVGGYRNPARPDEILEQAQPGE